jgi:two-component system phosphate regulon response regulator OmpR
LDDDIHINRLIDQYLTRYEYLVTTTLSIAQAKKMLLKTDFDILILDVLMNNHNDNTLMFLKNDVRTLHYYLPTIVVSALSDVDNRIYGLESGADDYLIKPFEPKELLLRINKLLPLKRKNSIKVHFGNFSFDLSTLTLYHDNIIVNLTTAEQRLLQILCTRVNEVVSRNFIIDTLYGVNSDKINYRSIDMQIQRLRVKIQEDQKNPQYLYTVRNIGYKLITNKHL